MDILFRTIAIIIEVVILAAIMFAMLSGVRLALFDLGVGLKYKKFITMALVVVGCLSVVFFISHLTSFYPEI